MYSCFFKAALRGQRRRTDCIHPEAFIHLGQPGGWLLILGNEVGVMLAPPHPLTEESQAHKSLPCANTVMVSHTPKVSPIQVLMLYLCILQIGVESGAMHKVFAVLVELSYQPHLAQK